MIKKIKLLFIILCGVSGSVLAAEPLTVTQVVKETLASNPELLQSKQKLVIADAQIQQAWSTVMPSLTLQASATRMDSYQARDTADSFGQLIPSLENLFQKKDGADFSKASGSFSFSQPYAFSTKLMVTQTLFGMYIFPTLGSAAIVGDMAKAEYSQKRQEVLFTTLNAYYDAVRAQMMADLTQKNVVVLSEHLRKVQEMLRLGMVTNSAVLQSEVQLKSRQKDAIDADRFLVLAKAKLNIALGRKVDEKVVFPPNLSHIDVAIPTGSIESLLNKGIATRPDLQTLSNLKKLRSAYVGIVSSDYWPTVTLVGQYGFTGPNGDVLHTANKDWLVTIQANWNIFNGFQTTAKVSDAEAQFKQVEIAEKQAQDFAKLDIMDAVLKMNSNRKQLELATTSQELAKRNFDEMTIRFNTGGASNQDILDAELMLITSKTQYINALIDQEISLFNLKKATGTLTF